jgi:hypothetical protein
MFLSPQPELGALVISYKQKMKSDDGDTADNGHRAKVSLPLAW